MKKSLCCSTHAKTTRFLEFKFTPKGGVLLKGGGERLRKTVEICNLQRKRLRRPRLRIVNRTKRALEAIEIARNHGQTEIEGRLRAILDKDLLDSSCIYAAVARDVVREPRRFGLENFTL